ncbi:hypothetical protein FZEAL_5569 [Fusarium zealandicum]|uniref:Apple domain-containing protein n=1 Tax=Fusarium zealandicum TaxID=1053134 RepID=A0A8H4XKQ4_9HYPO|nr:hypothetical protein FZEAL_5569 [Fusarium zealandicum]
MAESRDNEGLQVDYGHDNASKAPEAIPYYGQNTGYYVPEGNRDTTPHRSVPFGLSIWAFGVLIALITAVIVGGAVGGGLGAALANQNQSECASSNTSDSSQATSCNATSSATADDATKTTAYAPIRASDIANLTLDCPESKESQRPGSGYKFDVYCQMNGPQTPDGPITDIVSVPAYFLDDCLGACEEMTRNNKRDKKIPRCDSIAFTRQMNISRSDFGNCWLKNGKLDQDSEVWKLKDINMVYAELKT